MSKFLGCSSWQLVCSHVEAGRGTKAANCTHSTYIVTLSQTDTPSTDGDEPVRITCCEDAKHLYVTVLDCNTMYLSVHIPEHEIQQEALALPEGSGH